jgi:hypothetical protein
MSEFMFLLLCVFDLTDLSFSFGLLSLLLGLIVDFVAILPGGVWVGPNLLSEPRLLVVSVGFTSSSVCMLPSTSPVNWSFVCGGAGLSLNCHLAVPNPKWNSTAPSGFASFFHSGIFRDEYSSVLMKL